MDRIFETPIGTIIGWENDLVVRATGIPYAYAERFCLPTPFPFFYEPFSAKTLSPAPAQRSSGMTNQILGFDNLQGLEIEEHCQYLSITMPKDIRTDQRLPVMVWVYGGSYTSGAGDAPAYDPTYLVNEQKVVVVKINYRLGLLGFLGGDSSRPSNLGLFDIIEAIQWVKKNIHAFGGDLENITLFGQSAGGDAIAHLMIADNVKGLFKRVIIQSAPLGLRNNKQKMIAAMKKMGNKITADTPLPEILDLQSAITEKMKIYGKNGGMPFGVEYGQAPLPAEEEAEKMWEERAEHIDVLMGCGDNEIALLTHFSRPLSVLQKIPLIGKPLLRLMLRTSTNIIYKDPATAFTNRISHKHGASIYQYLFTWGKENGYGAVHIIDIPLLFGDELIWKKSMLTKDIPWSKVYEDGKQVRAIWGKFARDGNLDDLGELPGILTYCRVG